MWNNQGGFNQGGGYGDHGGGYLNSPTQFGASQQTTSDNQKPQRAQNLRPVTVSMILRAEQVQDKFMLGSIELHEVTLVGLVRSVKEATSRIDYEIDDMTGPYFELRQFIDNDENTPEAERVLPMRENTYVRAVGHVRMLNGKRMLATFRVLPITDFNELTSHMLEVMYTFVYLTKGPKTSDASSTAMDTTMNVSKPGDMKSTASSTTHVPGLNPIQQQVLSVVCACLDEQGTSITAVCDRLKGVPPRAVRDAIDFLSGEGHIYSTIDDEHYKSTESL